MRFSKKTLFNTPGFFKDFTHLLAGNIGVQIIAISTYPFLTRLFNPEDFGELSLFVSISTMLVACIPARYDLAAVLTDNYSRVRNLLAISWRVLVVYTLIVCIFLIVGFIWWENLNIRPLLPVKINYLLFLPLLIFFIGSYQIYESYLNSVRDFKSISVIKVFSRIVNSSIALLVGFLYLESLNGLIVGFILCNLLVFIAVIRKLWSLINFKREKKYTEKLRANFRDFAWFSAPNKVITLFVAQLPIYFIALFFGSEELGYYTLAYSLLAIPEGIITTSLSPIFYKTIAERVEAKRPVTPIILKTWLLVFSIGIFPALLIYFFGPYVFQIAFGANWKRSGEFAAILAPFLLIMSMGTASGSALTVFRKQYIALLFSIVKLIIRPLSLYIGYLSRDIIFALELFVLVNVIQIIVFNAYTIWYSYSRTDQAVGKANL